MRGADDVRQSEYVIGFSDVISDVPAPMRVLMQNNSRALADITSKPNIRAEGFRDSKKTLVLKKVALIRRFWRFTWRV